DDGDTMTGTRTQTYGGTVSGPNLSVTGNGDYTAIEGLSMNSDSTVDVNVAKNLDTQSGSYSVDASENQIANYNETGSVKGYYMDQSWTFHNHQEHWGSNDDSGEYSGGDPDVKTSGGKGDQSQTVITKLHYLGPNGPSSTNTQTSSGSGGGSSSTTEDTPAEPAPVNPNAGNAPAGRGLMPISGPTRNAKELLFGPDPEPVQESYQRMGDGRAPLRPNMGPIGSSLADIEQDKSRSWVVRAAAGTAAGFATLFEKVPGGFLDSASKSRDVVRKGIENAKNPIDKGAGVIALGYNLAGEGFGIFGLLEAEATLAGTPITGVASAPKAFANIGELSAEHQAILRNVWRGEQSISAIPQTIRQQLAALYSRVAAQNPAGSAQAAFNQARANYLLGKGPNPGPSVVEFSRRTGIPIYRRGEGVDVP
ncbi:MAG: hypothetical protein ACREHD_06595, partial [Pirellulales bacterium]